MTFKEFYHYSVGFQIRKAREMEPYRLIAYCTLAANRDPKKPFPTIDKFWPLYTDPKPLIIDHETGLQKIKELQRKWRVKN
jgi:hypothetical protein